MQVYENLSRCAGVGTGERNNKERHLSDHGVFYGRTHGYLVRKARGVDIDNESHNECGNLKTGKSEGKVVSHMEDFIKS